MWSYSAGYGKQPLQHRTSVKKPPMTRTRLRSHASIAAAAIAAALILCAPQGAPAQERQGGFLDNLFNRGEPAQGQGQPQGQFQDQSQGGGDSRDIGARIDRIENALRQLTGTVEELQHQNRQLQMQLQQMGGAAPAPSAGMPARRAPVTAPPAAGAPRGDVFNPAMHPNAPGAPRALGQQQGMNPPDPNVSMPAVTAVGAPNGRDAGAPLDLNSLASTLPGPGATIAAPGGQLPPPPPRNTSATGAQLATLPPSASPRDEYDLAYGYVLHKDYGLAAQAFRDFLRKYPKDGKVPEANYWLGESLFQQQNYTEAAKHFLNVATKYEHDDKAPDALLRLGQSMAALNHKEAACATLAEVGRKFPHASASVKHGVAREQKRAHC
jgi:tol-pal system protein YbgF